MAYGENVIFENFYFEPKENKITCILGSSGCGKTTLLKMISGLLPFDGERDFPSDISYAFQSPRLIPSRTVKRNMDLILSGKIKDKEIRSQEIDLALRSAKLDGVQDKYPAELSGGMAQRVSIARAFCFPSPLLLMDEPFQSLDVKLKDELLKTFSEMHAQNPRTVVFVTHDLDEAILLADRIIALGTPPNGVIADYTVDTAPSARSLRAPELAELRANIYEILTK